MERYAEVSLSANERYMQVLSTIDDPTAAYCFLNELGERRVVAEKPVRALNPLSVIDMALLQAVFRGEHAIRGFKSCEIAARMGLFKAKTPIEKRRVSARMNRLLGVLRGHGLIAKIPRTRRYRLSDRGAKLIGAMVYLREKGLYEALDVAA